MAEARRDEGGEPVDELEGRERQVRAPIGTGFGQVVDQLVGAACLQPLQGERGSGTVAQDALERSQASMRTSASTEKLPLWAQRCISWRSSSASHPRRKNQRSTRRRTWVCTAATAYGDRCAREADATGSRRRLFDRCGQNDP